jgi:hypothetical protein
MRPRFQPGGGRPVFCTERSCRMIACQCAPCAGARTASAAPGACLPFRAGSAGGEGRPLAWTLTRQCVPKGPRLGTPPGGNGSGVTRSPREVPCAGSPGVFLPIYRQKHFGKPDTNGTHGTHAGTRRITQSVSHRRRRTTHTTHNQAHNHLVPDPPRTHTRTTARRADRRRYPGASPGAIARSRPDPNAHARAHVNARGATPRSRPWRPNPRSQPNPRGSDFIQITRAEPGAAPEAAKRPPPGGPHLPPANPRPGAGPSKDHPSKCAAVQAVYFGPYSVVVQRTTSNIIHT